MTGAFQLPGKPVWQDRGWERPDRSGIWTRKSCLKCIVGEENDERTGILRNDRGRADPDDPG